MVCIRTIKSGASEVTNIATNTFILGYQIYYQAYLVVYVKFKRLCEFFRLLGYYAE